MQYALLYFETPTEYARRTGPDQDAYWGAWTTYMGMMHEKGVSQGGQALHPGQSTVVRSAGADRIIEDGPFAEAREELGGFVIVDVPDLDAALTYAQAAPCAAPGAGHVEVHPVLQMQTEDA
ncbi:MAG: YciI family protein [Pseudomonadota bacterium]